MIKTADLQCLLVTVIIPVRNAADTLNETLRSVAAQNHSLLEILIIDDGSTDKSVDIALAFCETDARARLLRKPNGGVASARNLGIAEAQGEFVAPIDADDLWHREHLSKLVAKVMEPGPAAGFVFALLHQIDGDSNIIGSNARIESAGIRQMVYQNFVGCGSALLIRRSVAIAIGGYDERLRAAGHEGCEDLLLQFSIAGGYPIRFVPEYLVGYRQRRGSMSSNVEQMHASSVLAYKLFRKRLPGLNIPVAAEHWRYAGGLLTLARYRARRGRIFGAARCAAVAVWFDPIGTGAAILYDAQRIGMRLLSLRAGPEARLEPFLDSNPRPAVDMRKPDSVFTPHGLLQRLQYSRIRLLAETDRADPVSARAIATDSKAMNCIGSEAVKMSVNFPSVP